MGGRPAGYFWINTSEAQLAEIKLINEYIKTLTGLSSAMYLQDIREITFSGCGLHLR